MKKLAFLLTCSLALLPVSLGAQEVCPCVPVAHQWIVEACDSWNCAAAATIMANGDKYVMAMPTNSDDYKWVIVKRVASGSATVSPNAPYAVETFDDSALAIARFHAIDQQKKPMMLTGADGKFLVISRATPVGTPTRAVRH
jgi:hypothetical protein